jgi:hypothetical protein
MTDIGFTGTRDGMSDHQKEGLLKLIMSMDVRTFHHGDCVGADAEAHDIVCPYAPIIIHPPSNSKMRAYKDTSGAPGALKPLGALKPSKVLEPKDYIARNHDIVDSTTVLIATPQGGPSSESSPSAKRSGTWATIRYARLMGRTVHIL